MPTTFLDELILHLRLNLPGQRAQRLMAPEHNTNTRFDRNPPDAQQSSILMLIYPKNHQLYTVFMHRTDHGGKHGGQISFPGGRNETADKSLWHTALRETQEEIGIDTEQITYLGSLSNLFIPVSNYNVTPFLGYMAKLPRFSLNPDEVREIITVPLNSLKNPENKGFYTFYNGERTINAPCYIFNGYKVWGATAMIISEFNEIVNSVEE